MRSAASAGAATMASRVLGLVRDAVLAALFGAGPAMDAYLVAFRIPNLLRDLFAEGAMSAAFVPTFTAHLTTSGKASAWRLARHVLNALLVTTGVLVLLGVVFAEPLVRALTSERYEEVPGQIALTVQLARIMLPTLLLVALAAALMGMLNSLRHYFIPALSPAMFNVVIIVSAVTAVPVMPVFGLEPIAGIAIGALLGGVAQVALQVPTLRRQGFRYGLELDWRDPGLRRVLLLMGPGTVGLAATQVNLFVNTLLATGVTDGAVSWLNYAFRLRYLPIGIFGVSVATAVLPAVSRHVAERRTDGVRDTVANGLSLMFMMNAPATVGLIVLATPLVRVIFERGEFSPADTAATAAALQMYALGLLAYSVVRIVSPTFYALGRSRTPVLVSIATMGVNVVLNVTLVQVLGFRGLALGTSLAALFNGVALLILLRPHVGGLNGRQVLGSLVRIALAAAAMGAAAVGVEAWLAARMPGDALAIQIVRLTLTIGVALAVLAAASWLLRIREFTEGVSLVTRRLRPPSR
jgi:putative peptidoglycan lipid II flippase